MWQGGGVGGVLTQKVGDVYRVALRICLFVNSDAHRVYSDSSVLEYCAVEEAGTRRQTLKAPRRRGVIYAVARLRRRREWKLPGEAQLLRISDKL